MLIVRFIRWAMYQVRITLEKWNWTVEDIKGGLGVIWMFQGICTKLLAPAPSDS